MILKLLVIWMVLLRVANGASLATVEFESSNCTLLDGFKVITCAVRLSDFGEKIEELNMEDKNQIEDFKASCDGLKQCLSVKTCGKKLPGAEDVVIKIKNYCDAVIYVSSEFAECSEKLETKNSTCYESWTPFPDEIDTEIDFEKREEMNKKACDNFFGPNECMKDEIMETCGEQEWYGFRDHFISISNIILKCDFNNMV